MDLDITTWFEITERFGEQIDLLWAVGISLIAANLFILSGIIRKQARDCKDCVVIGILAVCIGLHSASAGFGYLSRATSILVLECAGSIDNTVEDNHNGDRCSPDLSRYSCDKCKLDEYYVKMESKASLQLATFTLGVILFLVAFIFFPGRISQSMRSS